MLHSKLLNPGSIAVVGGSNNIHKPGGKLVSNLKNSFKGKLYIVNPKESTVQGLACFTDIKNLPDTDLAFIAIPAKLCPEVISTLAYTKKTKAFVIISAGFSEDSDEGAKLEQQLSIIVNDVKGTLIGPNCIGVVNQNYSGIFTAPVPHLHSCGCEFISTSGATAMFIIESALTKGLPFSSVYSVGNSAQTSVEDILEHLDNEFNPKTSSRVILLYLESIKSPDKLLEHASSLINKGCKIAAIKAGSSEAGSRAALSHTGALANPDLAVEGLFRKAGIVRCSGREELTTVASVFMHKELTGKNIAIITHAGGPAVMLTDALAEGKLEIPRIYGPESEELLSQLPHGSSVRNPIDFLATGTDKHLDLVIEYCDKKFDNIDAMMVIFGSTGLSKVFSAYEVLHQKILSCKKPIFPILPSILTAQKEVNTFLSKGHIIFPDEVQLGRAIAKVYNTPHPSGVFNLPANINITKARKIIESSPSGFLPPEKSKEFLETAGIKVIPGFEVFSQNELIEKANLLGYPLALKIVGSVHKTELGGVSLNINTEKYLLTQYKKLMQIENVNSLLVQQMISGTELFIGAKYEATFGHIIMCGLGGIFVEVLHDIASGLAPLTYEEAYSMISSLKAYKIIKGTRGHQGISEDIFADIIVRISSILRYCVEVKELDLNPLIAVKNKFFVADSKIRIEK